MLYYLSKINYNLLALIFLLSGCMHVNNNASVENISEKYVNLCKNLNKIEQYNKKKIFTFIKLIDLIEIMKILKFYTIKINI